VTGGWVVEVAGLSAGSVSGFCELVSRCVLSFFPSSPASQC
jgi:hypothetical protein